jgi:hypothetical protein
MKYIQAETIIPKQEPTAKTNKEGNLAPKNKDEISYPK